MFGSDKIFLAILFKKYKERLFHSLKFQKKKKWGKTNFHIFPENKIISKNSWKNESLRCVSRRHLGIQSY